MTDALHALSQNVCFAPGEGDEPGHELHCPFVAGSQGEDDAADAQDLALLRTVAAPMDMEDLASMFVDRFCGDDVDTAQFELANTDSYASSRSSSLDSASNMYSLPMQTPPIDTTFANVSLDMDVTSAAAAAASVPRHMEHPSGQHPSRTSLPSLRPFAAVPILRKPNVKRAISKRENASSGAAGSSSSSSSNSNSGSGTHMVAAASGRSTASPSVVPPRSLTVSIKSSNSTPSSTAPSSPSSSTSPVVENVLLQKKRNCEASARYRRRKQSELENLRQQFLEMHNENKRLQKRVTTLEHENKKLLDRLRDGSS